jgi:hypothetical protein
MKRPLNSLRLDSFEEYALLMNPNNVGVKIAKTAIVAAVILSFCVPASARLIQSQSASPAAQSLAFEVASIKPTKLMELV